jgi:hypothetical protein
VTHDCVQRVLATSEPSQLDEDPAVLAKWLGQQGRGISSGSDQAFVSFPLLRQDAVELERDLGVGTRDLVQQRLDRNQPGGGNQGSLRLGALARLLADRLQLEVGKMDFAGRVDGEHGQTVLLVVGRDQGERLFMEGPFRIGRQVRDADRGGPAVVVDHESGVAALEALGLDVAAELVGFAGHQRHALLACAERAGRAAVGFQDDRSLVPFRTSVAAIDHIPGRGRTPEFREAGLFGVEAAVDQQILALRDRSCDARGKNHDAQPRQQRSPCHACRVRGDLGVSTDDAAEPTDRGKKWDWRLLTTSQFSYSPDNGDITAHALFSSWCLLNESNTDWLRLASDGMELLVHPAEVRAEGK